MNEKLRMQPVEPSHHEQHLNLFTGSLFSWPRYPANPTGKLVRDLRVVLGVSLRQAAKALQCSAVELSALEMGSATLIDETEGFQEVCRRLIIASGYQERLLPPV